MRASERPCLPGVYHGGPPRLCRSSVWSRQYASLASSSSMVPLLTSRRSRSRVRWPEELVNAAHRVRASSSSLAKASDLRAAIAMDADSPASSRRDLAPSDWRQTRFGAPGLEPDRQFELVRADGQHGQPICGKGEQLIKAVHGCHGTACQAGAGTGLIGLPLHRGADAAQFARITWMPPMYAVSDEDRPAAYLKQLVTPADNREASRDRGIDQHCEMFTAHGWRMRRPQDPAVLAARLPLGGDG